MGCGAGLLTFLGVFLDSNFLANLLLNVNMLPTLDSNFFRENLLENFLANLLLNVNMLPTLDSNFFRENLLKKN